MIDQEKIGNFIKKTRLENHLTQKDFAEKLGVSYQAVSKWERGLNLPDISVLREISKEFQVDIDEILEGKKKRKNKKRYPFLIIFLILLLAIIIYFLTTKNHDFEFNPITTTCKNFDIIGSAAYNKDKTSLFISNINYCGKKDEVIYKKLNCSLYEKKKDSTTKVASCTKGKNKTLNEYLENIQMKVDHFSSNCHNKNLSNFYLEIKALNEEDKTVIYKVPITIKEDCS